MFENAEIISRYTRLQAIEDGILVDLMQSDTVGAVREAGFRYPVAMTTTAFALAVWPIADADQDDDTPAEKWLKAKCQDLQGRLWDVLWMLKLAIRQGGTTILYRLSIMNHQTRRRNTITLKAVCGPNDDGSPCITIMLPDED